MPVWPQPWVLQYLVVVVLNSLPTAGFPSEHRSHSQLYRRLQLYLLISYSNILLLFKVTCTKLQSVSMYHSRLVGATCRVKEPFFYGQIFMVRVSLSSCINSDPSNVSSSVKEPFYNMIYIPNVCPFTCSNLDTASTVSSSKELFFLLFFFKDDT